MKTRSRKETRIQRKRQGFTTVQLSATEFLGEKDTDRKNPSGKENQPACFAYKRVFVQKGMLLITGIHLCVLFKRELHFWE